MAGKAKILLIEDDELVRALIAEVIMQAGYEVTQAENGKVGTKLFFENQFDLVITDIFMPEQDGIETILKLTKKQPGVKVFAISGGGERQSGGMFLDHAKLLGAHKVFAKPVEPKELLSAIKEELS